MDLDTFYNELFSLVHSVPKHNVLIIGVDMNTNIGKNINNKFSLQYMSNRDGEHLTDFILENRLTCLNTKFQKKKGKLWIYTYANNVKAHTDNILMNKKWTISTLNSEIYSSFEGASSDHQRYVWVHVEMRHKQPKLHPMTGPFLTIEILAINVW